MSIDLKLKLKTKSESVLNLFGQLGTQLIVLQPTFGIIHKTNVCIKSMYVLVETHIHTYVRCHSLLPFTLIAFGIVYTL